MGIDKFPQELYKSYRNYLMKRYYAFFHVFFLMEITKTEKKSHVFAVAPHAGAWIEILDLISILILLFVAPHAGAWIEMCRTGYYGNTGKKSLPMRERGLKCVRLSRSRSFMKSLPMRERGLKYISDFLFGLWP